MTQKRIVIFIALFLIILILIPIIISKVSKEPSNPIPSPTQTALSPTPIRLELTPTPSFPQAGLEMVIFKGKNALVPYTNLTIKLTDIFVPKKGCFDCITSARVEVKNNGELKILEYGSGGFAGTVVDKLEAFGYTFTASEFNQDSLKVKVEKKL
ncbi:MAG: hypothetical protein Q7K55_04385 [Candidatus Levybacteria bacterium]|nr:hypothetical protein [Candidatus Levybacteria bacterium]